ncbi:MAG TPA: hypothetical protein VNT30_12035 [Stellaceae bacterium]|nr:hypothetical protein [Stellaceae bacterium]
MTADRFFAERDFIALIHFWDKLRGTRALPEWHGDVTKVPRHLLENMVVVSYYPTPRYNYVGAACVARWDKDPTGMRVDDLLGGIYARYIHSLLDETIKRPASVFSAAVFELGEELLITGRLMVPFSLPGSTEAAVVVGLHFFKGSDIKLRALSGNVFVEEVQRLMIVAAPEFCDRLEKARLYQYAARSVSLTGPAGHLDSVARELAGDAILPLPCYRDES